MSDERPIVYHDWETGMGKVDDSRNGLLLMVSLEQHNGHLAPEIATTAREFVDALWSPANAAQALVDAGEPVAHTGPRNETWPVCYYCAEALIYDEDEHAPWCKWLAVYRSVYGPEAQPKRSKDR